VLLFLHNAPLFILSLKTFSSISSERKLHSLLTPSFFRHQKSKHRFRFFYFDFSSGITKIILRFFTSRVLFSASDFCVVLFAMNICFVLYNFSFSVCFCVDPVLICDSHSDLIIFCFHDFSAYFVYFICIYRFLTVSVFDFRVIYFICLFFRVVFCFSCILGIFYFYFFIFHRFFGLV
jgi:hypothetical protein